MSPGEAEVARDGLDNDGDGLVDQNTVPTAYATQQEAVDGLADGTEICVEPGTYIEALDLLVRTLRFTCQRGAASTILELGSSAPMVTLEDGSDSAVASEVAFSGFTITGDEVSAAGVEVLGAFARLSGGSLTLSDIAVKSLSGSTSDGGVLEGLLVYVHRRSRRHGPHCQQRSGAVRLRGPRGRRGGHG